MNTKRSFIVIISTMFVLVLTHISETGDGQRRREE